MEREIKDLEDEMRRHKPLPRKKQNKKADKSKHPPPPRLPSLGEIYCYQLQHTATRCNRETRASVSTQSLQLYECITATI